ncbi:MAG: DUF4239 domain-containing protein [Proteobacteria bacterium]|nr:DUF4239 domain-containing protein [Pseudomonadota bacterium]
MPIVLWFNDLPLWQAGLLLIGGALLISLVGTAFTRTFFPERQLSLNNVVGGFQYMFLSNVYAGFIGFLLFGVYDRYDQVRLDMVSEVSALTSLHRLAATFPEGTRAQIRTGLHDYARGVVEVDWPQMRARQGNPSTTATLDDLEYLYGALEVTSKKQREVVKLSHELITEIRNDRGVRMFRSGGSLPSLLWAIALLAMAASIVFPWVFGAPNVNADVLMSTLTIVVMTSIVLVVLKLTFPFGGSAGIAPAPFTAFLSEFPSGGG